MWLERSDNMPSIDMEDLILDPDFAQPYTVYRKTGQWVSGRFEQTESSLQFYGPIVVNNVKDLMQVPEGDRARGVMAFYSTNPIYITQDNPEKGTSDEIEWRGERYRIFQVAPYNDYGYVKALGQRMAGD
jgi:hypothetical protein